MGLFSKIGEIIDDVKYEIQDTMFDLRYGDTSDKIKAVAKVAKVGADVAMLTTGVGQVAKTATTATKLATCGYCHSAKAVASLTVHAQKSNMIKAGTKIAEAAAVKVAASTMTNDETNTNNNVEHVNYCYNNNCVDYKIYTEDECKDIVRTMLLTGRWNMMDAVNFIKENYVNISLDVNDESQAKTIAYQFVLDVRKANNIN